MWKKKKKFKNSGLSTDSRKLQTLALKTSLVMVRCLFSFFMKLSRTFFHTNNSFLAYVSFLREKLSIRHEPWEKWGEGGGGAGWGEFLGRMNFSLTKYIHIFIFGPPPPPTHNFSKCPSLMTQTVNNEQKHFIDIVTVNGAMSQILE